MKAQEEKQKNKKLLKRQKQILKSVLEGTSSRLKLQTNDYFLLEKLATAVWEIKLGYQDLKIKGFGISQYYNNKFFVLENLGVVVPENSEGVNTLTKAVQQAISKRLALLQKQCMKSHGLSIAKIRFPSLLPEEELSDQFETEKSQQESDLELSITSQKNNKERKEKEEQVLTSGDESSVQDQGELQRYQRRMKRIITAAKLLYNFNRRYKKSLGVREAFYTKKGRRKYTNKVRPERIEELKNIIGCLKKIFEDPYLGFKEVTNSTLFPLIAQFEQNLDDLAKDKAHNRFQISSKAAINSGEVDLNEYKTQRHFEFRKISIRDRANKLCERKQTKAKSTFWVSRDTRNLAKEKPAKISADISTGIRLGIQGMKDLDIVNMHRKFRFVYAFLSWLTGAAYHHHTRTHQQLDDLEVEANRLVEAEQSVAPSNN